jgi:glycosyltransferase involved in cell wall biosynthesis
LVVKFQSFALGLSRESAPDEALADSPPTADQLPSEDPLTVLMVVPSLQAGAADTGTVDLVRILAAGGHRPIVVSSGGRLVPEITAMGAEFVAMKVASKNPAVMLRNAFALTRMIRERKCDVIHAHGRAPGWSAYYAARATGVPFLTSWYKGFREQNIFKRLYNSVMTRGDRVIAVGDQIADLIIDRHGTPWDRIAVLPASIDVDKFDPAHVSAARIDTVRRAWGIRPELKVILVAGRLLRRKGHDVVVRAVRRLKDLGLKDFLCVFLGEGQERTRYTGELWDLVLATNTTDVIRMVGPSDDMPAAYAVASVVVSAATQPEGLQRAILEAQAMARPVVVSDLGAGPDAVLAPPAVSEDRMTGLRFSSGDDAALAAALVRLFSLHEQDRAAIGARGRAWVVGNFNIRAVSEPTLSLYAEVVRRHRQP